MLLSIVILIFGVVALAKGEFKITAKRKVKGSIGRILGVVLLVGAGAYFIPEYAGMIQLVLLVMVIIAGLVSSEKIETEQSNA